MSNLLIGLQRTNKLTCSSEKNEWARTSLLRSLALVHAVHTRTVPQIPESLPTPQKPTRARPSVVGVSKPPDMSPITEGSSETPGSPHASPTLLSAPPPLASDPRPMSTIRKSRRKSPNSAARSKILDRQGLNDVTNALPTGKRSSGYGAGVAVRNPTRTRSRRERNLATKEAGFHLGPAVLDATLASAHQRRTKKQQLPTPSLPKDLLDHGNSSQTTG